MSIWRKGFRISTGIPNRSFSCVSRLTTREEPPEMKSWSIFSVEVVARKKSKVFCSSCARSSETERRIGRMSWSDCSPAASPFLRASACSNERESCFWMASVYWLPPKEMSRQKIVFAPGEDVDVGDRGADVDQRDDAAGLDRVVGLVGVLEGEGVHVHEDRRLAGLGDDARVVGDLVLLDGDQQDVHRLAAAGLEHDVVEVDVVDVEGDVLLGFPADRLGQLLGGHGRQGDLLDDDGVARQGGPEVGIPDVQGGNDAVDGVDDQGGSP